MVNNKLCRAGLHRRYGETKRDPARISERAGETPVMPAAFRTYRRLKATESGRVTPICAVHA